MCFEELDLEFERAGQSALLLGDNGDGKSTVLRCLAMGLCDKSSAGGLLGELAGPLLHRRIDGSSAAFGSIEVELERNDGITYRISTEIRDRQSFEEVSQKLHKFKDGKPQKGFKQQEFPWDEIFVVGYGAGARMPGTTNYEDYIPTDAVYTLFNYGFPLQNPDFILLWLINEARERADAPVAKEENDRSMRASIQGLMAGLLPDQHSLEDFVITTSGVVVKGWWGSAILRELSDGYQATITLVLDMISWWFKWVGPEGSDAWTPESINGIVILDEIEQHLHPRWQRRILPSLIDKFPNIQFIVSTHSPLVASSCKNVQVHQFKQGRPERGRPYGWLPEDVYDMMGVHDTRPDPLQKVLAEYERLDLKRLKGTTTQDDEAKLRELAKELAAMPDGDPIRVSLRLANISKSREENK